MDFEGCQFFEVNSRHALYSKSRIGALRDNSRKLNPEIEEEATNYRFGDNNKISVLIDEYEALSIVF